MHGAEAERQADAAQIFFLFFFSSALESDSCRRRGTFAAERGAWLGSRQNLAKMSGGLDKTDYERLIHLVSQNDPP